MKIQTANMDAPDFRDLLDFHIQTAQNQKATYVFSADRLRGQDVIMFTARSDDGALMGFAGLKTLSPTHGEIKSVRTHPDYLRRGVSHTLMEHLIGYARKNDMSRLSLETHPFPRYQAARALYENLGFTYCGPFGGYPDSGDSVFMTRNI